jgi:protein arginine kinase activator
MFCEECHKNLANVFITQVENNTMIRKRLCEDCARQAMIAGSPMDVLSMLPQLLAGVGEPGTDAPMPEDLREDILLCLNCGSTLTDLRETGRLGCPECFEAFAEPLVSILPEIQHGLLHTGKTPANCPESVLMQRRLMDLRSRLTELVERENFEVAAEIRDQIKSLEEQLFRTEGEAGLG